jgi:hypothetical protein
MMMIMVDQRCVRWCGEDAIQNWKLFDSVQSTLSEYAQFSIELILNCPLKKIGKTIYLFELKFWATCITMDSRFIKIKIANKKQ